MSVRLPRKMLGWRRFLYGQPLWPDILTRCRKIGRLSFTVAAGCFATSALVVTAAAVEMKCNPPGLYRERIRNDLVIDRTTRPTLVALEPELELAYSQGCPVMLQLDVLNQYQSAKDKDSLIQLHPWLKTVTAAASPRDALTQLWRERGYFDKFPARTDLGRRSTMSIKGLDIGCSLGRSSNFENNWNLDQAVRALSLWGVAILPAAVDASALRDDLEISSDFERASDLGKQIIKQDVNTSHYRPVANRLHLLLRGSRLEEKLERLHASWMPILQTAAELNAPGSRLHLSDARLVVIDCAALKEKWRCADATPGYTVYVPLHTRTAKAGSVAVLPGSHVLRQPGWTMRERLGSLLDRFKLYGGTDSVCAISGWSAGTAVILDNRTMVSGEASDSFIPGAYLSLTYSYSDPEEVAHRWRLVQWVSSFAESMTKLNSIL